jgi:hypothetical protein
MNVTRRLLATGAALVLTSSCATANQDEHAPHPTTAEERAVLAVVTQRIAAYNSHDIDAFLATYDPNVRIFVFPDRLLGTGTDRLRRIFGPQFARGDGTVRVRVQDVIDTKVVSAEDVTIGGVMERNISIYTIVGGRIQEVRLIEPGE